MLPGWVHRGRLLIFGRRASEQVAELLADHHIEVITGTHPVKYEEGALAVVPGEPIEVSTAHPGRSTTRAS